MPSRRLVAMLRAVNVGGRSSLAMADLRELTADLGHRDVTTYIQSGNVVFTTDQPSGTVAARQRIGDQLSDAIAARTGLQAPVMVRTEAELRAAIAAMPYLDDEPSGSKLMIVFLSAAPTKAAIATLDRERFAPDRFEVIGREMYIHFPNGAGRSKLTPNQFERLGATGTARNLNTVRKLADLATTT
jgi:uncharacterized protein (DUF1697 family)